MFREEWPLGPCLAIQVRRLSCAAAPPLQRRAAALAVAALVGCVLLLLVSVAGALQLLVDADNSPMEIGD